MLNMHFKFIYFLEYEIVIENSERTLLFYIKWLQTGPNLWIRTIKY